MSQTVWDIVVDISQDIDGNMWFLLRVVSVSLMIKVSPFFTTKLHLRTRLKVSFKGKMYVGTEQGVSIIDIKLIKW
jgi:hypothetical protein